jgi:hypothetical protein
MIMGKGELKAFGSPSQLKHEFGAGYELFISLGGTSSDQLETRIHTLLRTMRSKVPAASLLHERKSLSPGLECCVQKWMIPFDSQHLFSGLFQVLDAKQEELHIVTWKLSMIKLDDIFMRFAHETSRGSDEHVVVVGRHVLDDPVLDTTPSSRRGNVQLGEGGGGGGGCGDGSGGGGGLGLPTSMSDPGFFNHRMAPQPRVVSTLSQRDIRWMEEFEATCHAASSFNFNRSDVTSSSCSHHSLSLNALSSTGPMLSSWALPPSPLSRLPVILSRESDDPTSGVNIKHQDEESNSNSNKEIRYSDALRDSSKLSIDSTSFTGKRPNELQIPRTTSLPSTIQNPNFNFSLDGDLSGTTTTTTHSKHSNTIRRRSNANLTQLLEDSLRAERDLLPENSSTTSGIFCVPKIPRTISLPISSDTFQDDDDDISVSRDFAAVTSKRSKMMSTEYARVKDDASSALPPCKMKTSTSVSRENVPSLHNFTNERHCVNAESLQHWASSQCVHSKPPSQQFAAGVDDYEQDDIGTTNMCCKASCSDCTQIALVVQKRMISAKRNIATTLSKQMVSLVLVAVSLSVLSVNLTVRPISRVMNAGMWGLSKTEVVYGSGSNDSSYDPQPFDSSSMTWQYAGEEVHNSYELSLKLAAESGGSRAGYKLPRFGSYIFGDVVVVGAAETNGDGGGSSGGGSSGGGGGGGGGEVVVLSEDVLSIPVDCTLLHNATASPHALPVFLAELAVAQTNKAIADMGGTPHFFSAANYRVVSKPLPLSSFEGPSLEDEVKLSFFAILFLLIPLSMCPATYGVAHAVTERANKALTVQVMAGLRPSSYWLANIFWSKPDG